MNIQGLQKTTLLDYPNLMAATIFVGGCNFRCPFCHNEEWIDNKKDSIYSDEEILAFLEKRKNILQGLCISGGEPTLQPDLHAFIKKIKEKTLLKIKLDTNGYRPEALKKLLDDQLLDYVAMDIKASKDEYEKLAGIKPLAFERIEESMALLKNSGISYEFRTTFVKGLHSLDQITALAKLVDGCQQLYIQNFREFRDEKNSLQAPFSEEELKEIEAVLKSQNINCQIRSI